MRINRSVEHGVVVLLMLALAKDHAPQKSSTLAAAMGVSDSYLKKTLRRLVQAGLVDSSASKTGGYTLARPAEEVTLGDAYRALDSDELLFRDSPMAEAVFPDDPQHVAAAEGLMRQAFAEANDAFLGTLDAHPLTEFLEPGAWERGVVDWEALAGHTD